MKEKNNNPISQNIKKYRLLNNMTQEELAGKLYLDTQYYAQLERGERNFTIEKIIANFPGSVILNRVFGFTKLGFPYKINVFRTFLLKMCGFFAILIE